MTVGVAAMAWTALCGGQADRLRTPSLPTFPEKGYAWFVPAGCYIEGDPHAPCTLVEFSDFQCGHCKAAWPVVQDMLCAHRSRLKVAFRHYRASSATSNSRLLARAAEAAGMQGGFFQMTDQLFAHYADFDGASADDVERSVTQLARSIGLDPDRFLADLRSPDSDAAWQRDARAGADLGIQGTPAFFFLSSTGKPTPFYSVSQARKWLADTSHLR